MACLDNLDDLPLLVGNSVQLVNQFVNLGVGGSDFAVDAFNLRGSELAGMLLLVQFQHPVNEFHDLVVPGLVGRVREIDRANGKLFDVLFVRGESNRRGKW